ncbi:CLC_0170 family protein [Alkaliphilus hydrothermalis]|uniref:Uncharacterized protein n=1 Tax=Alkaliphilus hydrothermalis TaxID=1482730 RepID=A0ABS2NSM2_9FIRM|nr:CLC_0170 family protein [Alkaliphilus hydrothermalis]MBM7615948.1 hypothetical protein [Alkaliphilus hydrothermalis]
MQMYLERLDGLFNSFILFVIVSIGIITLLADVPKLKRRKLMKEVKLARGISLFYIFGGLLSYIALRILL